MLNKFYWFLKKNIIEKVVSHQKISRNCISKPNKKNCKKSETITIFGLVSTKLEFLLQNEVKIINAKPITKYNNL